MTYTYLCEECGKETEIICSMSEMKRTIVCPDCGKTARKVIEAPTLVGVSSSKDRISKEMKRRNKDAEKRMRYSHKSVKGG